MNPTDQSPDPVSPFNQLTRRNFMKKSALTVGAITILGQGTGLAANCTSCTAHGTVGNTSAACTYLLEIHVVFDEQRANPAYHTGTYAKSGYQYRGTLKYRWNTCSDSLGARWTTGDKVYSGGHRTTTTAITDLETPDPHDNHDTCCPGGIFYVTPDMTGLIGFPLDTSMTSPLRTHIEIHDKGETTGCIAFEDSGKWDTFRLRLMGNNYPTTGNNTSCYHSDCKYKVKVNVEYIGVTPFWTGATRPV
jgi:hypothetical protein